MFNGPNCDRKSQLSGILSQPLNPRECSCEHESRGWRVKVNNILIFNFNFEILNLRNKDKKTSGNYSQWQTMSVLGIYILQAAVSGSKHKQ